jgi:hypothetical protein
MPTPKFRNNNREAFYRYVDKHKCKGSGGSYDTSATADCDTNVGYKDILKTSDHVENNSKEDIVFSRQWVGFGGMNRF